jgi:hypothetical protein
MRMMTSPTYNNRTGRSNSQKAGHVVRKRPKAQDDVLLCNGWFLFFFPCFIPTRPYLGSRNPTRIGLQGYRAGGLEGGEALGISCRISTLPVKMERRGVFHQVGYSCAFEKEDTKKEVAFA